MNTRAGQPRPRAGSSVQAFLLSQPLDGLELKE
jgi:hypothetical protein